MGLEAATIMAISAAVSGATALYGASQAGKGGEKAPLAPLAPEAPPAAEKTPDRASMKKKVSAAVGAGAGAPADTLLTGPAGVQLDASILGKNTLLGG